MWSQAVARKPDQIVRGKRARATTGASALQSTACRFCDQASIRSAAVRAGMSSTAMGEACGEPAATPAILVSGRGTSGYGHEGGRLRTGERRSNGAPGGGRVAASAAASIGWSRRLLPLTTGSLTGSKSHLQGYTSAGHLKSTRATSLLGRCRVRACRPCTPQQLTPPMSTAVQHRDRRVSRSPCLDCGTGLQSFSAGMRRPAAAGAAALVVLCLLLDAPGRRVRLPIEIFSVPRYAG